MYILKPYYLSGDAYSSTGIYNYQRFKGVFCFGGSFQAADMRPALKGLRGAVSLMCPRSRTLP